MEPVERVDDRRMLKAVHNWPFKFRGEKDMTSLNIFLDRVETFARSEGMSDRTLLSSIKHLLQEDALDWYARALNQHNLHTWTEFKQEIRKEFLPGGYAQILRLEASFRFQGQNEPFAKYYRDIAALFRFVTPPMTEEEKYFIVKKNMTADYAAIVTAARPQTLKEMVEICSSYDETRMLLNRQRRIPVPHNALLEPNFATPSVGPKIAMSNQSNQRFGRVHVMEQEDNLEERLTPTGPSVRRSSLPINESTYAEAEQEWQEKMDQLTEQVNAIKAQFERRGSKPAPSLLPTALRAQSSRFEDLQLQRQQVSQQQHNSQRTHPMAQRQWQLQGSSSGQLQRAESLPEPEPQRNQMLCWNCDEEGHRFMDCPKPQAVLFCYRCGRKGYSLRSCFTCRTDSGNATAENRH